VSGGFSTVFLVWLWWWRCFPRLHQADCAELRYKVALCTTTRTFLVGAGSDTTCGCFHMTICILGSELVCTAAHSTDVLMAMVMSHACGGVCCQAFIAAAVGCSIARAVERGVVTGLYEANRCSRGLLLQPLSWLGDWVRIWPQQQWQKTCTCLLVCGHCCRH